MERNKYILFLIILSSIFSTPHKTPDNWQLEYKMTNPIYDPHDFWIVENNVAIIHDLGYSNYPIYKINLKKGKKTDSLRTGRGPGEVSSTYYKRLSQTTDDKYLLWDTGLTRTTFYNEELQYLTEVSGEQIKTRLYQSGLVNDSTLFVVYGGLKKFIEVFRLNKDYDIKESLWHTNISDHKNFSPLQNHLQKQGIFLDSDVQSGEAYLGFEFSSLIICITEKGIKYQTKKPVNYSIVKVDTQKEGYHMPDAGNHPQGIRSVSVDGNYIYVLYSNESPSFFDKAMSVFDMSSLIQELDHTDRVFVYRKKDGEFIKELKLPIEAKELKVHNKNFYLTSSISNNDIPAIYKFKRIKK